MADLKVSQEVDLGLAGIDGTVEYRVIKGSNTYKQSYADLFSYINSNVTTPTLQEVTDVGNTTTNAILGTTFIAVNGGVAGASISSSIGGNGQVQILQNGTDVYTTIYRDRIQIDDPNNAKVGQLSLEIGAMNASQSIQWYLPYGNGNSNAYTLAPYTDTNGNLNYVGFYINNGVNVYGSLAFDGVEGALELVNASGFGSNLKTLATSARINTLPDQDGTLAIKIYYEAQLKVSKDNLGVVTIVVIYNDSPYTFSSTSFGAPNTIYITPSGGSANMLFLCSGGLESPSGTPKTTNIRQLGTDILITYDAIIPGFEILEIQVNIKFVI
jgi:hypothetical protein